MKSATVPIEVISSILGGVIMNSGSAEVTAVAIGSSSIIATYDECGSKLVHAIKKAARISMRYDFTKFVHPES